MQEVNRQRSHYWQDELTAVTDFWDHCEHFSWIRAAYEPHVDKLADTMTSTKRLIEDMLGRLKDRRVRDSNANDWMCHERSFFHNCQLQKRIDSNEFPVLQDRGSGHTYHHLALSRFLEGESRSGLDSLRQDSIRQGGGVRFLSPLGIRRRLVEQRCPHQSSRSPSL